LKGNEFSGGIALLVELLYYEHFVDKSLVLLPAYLELGVNC